MSALLIGVLLLAVATLLGPSHSTSARLRRALDPGRADWRHLPMPLTGTLSRSRRGRPQPAQDLSILVQELAALLKGGRTPSHIWAELAAVHHAKQPGTPTLSGGSLAMLTAVQAEAAIGAPTGAAIRRAVPPCFPKGGREARIWANVAACFDIAESSGCPLAAVLARFAAQLEAEDDADAARQSALAGPKATVALLTWLPVLGLGLGAALGVDPLAVLFGTPLGLAALISGAVLTVVGRVWSARLVAAAAAAGLT